MGTHLPRLSRVLAAEHETDIEDFDTATVRLRHTEARCEETDLSYLRRVLHGRIDIIRAEQYRRESGDPRSIVDLLPSILADSPSASVRSVRHLDVDPGAAPGEYRERMEAILAGLDLSDVLDRSDAELEAARAALVGHEAEVSAYRGRVQAVMDRFADELARRYREGEATVDDLLHAETAEGQ